MKDRKYVEDRVADGRIGNAGWSFFGGKAFVYAIAMIP